MGCIELDGGIHTGQSQTSTEIPIGFCIDLLVFVSVSVSVLRSVSGSVNAPLVIQKVKYLLQDTHKYDVKGAYIEYY